MFGLLLRCVVVSVLKIVELLCMTTAVFYYFTKPKRCPAIDNNIFLYSASALAEKIRKKEITSEYVVTAYISRIKAVNPILNAIVEDRFDLAIKEAKLVDQILSETKFDTEELATKYPLLGLPLTVKESIAVEGLSHCSGRISLNGRKALKDADVVRLCKQAGAIPLLVSNTPELCTNFETYNKITGQTCNPYDSRRTCGGSSGGEAALLGAGASLIGIGSDIFGSIRLPAHYCGVWGHKPSSNAVSLHGHYPGCSDEKNWNAIFSLGPMCRYAADLPLMMNVIQEESAITALQLHQKIDIQDLKIYYMENNGGSILTHGINQEIVLAMKKLTAHMASKYACKVEQLNMEEFKYSPELSCMKILSLEDIETIYENKGEWAYGELLRYLTCRSNSVLVPIIFGIAKHLSGLIPDSVVSQYNDMLSQFKTTLCKTLGTNGVLIYPCHPRAAPFHGQTIGRITDYSYLGIFNALGLPVTNCPLGLNSDGLPIGIQIIAASNNDKLTLAVAQEIERSLGGWIPPIFASEPVPINGFASLNYDSI